MKTFKAGFRQVGSLIAGVLIGLSMVIIACMFTMTAAESSHSQILLALGASIVFAVGVMLQIVMTAAPRQPTPSDRGCTTSTHSTGQEAA
jgi:multisubunit Na+/H+ antiporter MnhB subunit